MLLEDTKTQDDILLYIIANHLDHFKFEEGKLYTKVQWPNRSKPLTVLEDWVEVYSRYDESAKYFVVNLTMPKHQERDSDRSQQLLHRLLWVVYNRQMVPEGMTIDHWNRNRYDHSPGNLRAVPPSVQNANKGKSRPIVKQTDDVLIETWRIVELYKSTTLAARHFDTDPSGIRARLTKAVTVGLKTQAERDELTQACLRTRNIEAIQLEGDRA